MASTAAYDPMVTRPGAARSTPRSWRNSLLGLGLFALLAVQWLALQHSVWHGQPGARPSPGCHSAARMAVSCWLAEKALGAGTSHEEGSPLCQMLGELVQPTPLSALPALALATPQAFFVVAFATAGWSSPFFARYSARAPPQAG